MQEQADVAGEKGTQPFKDSACSNCQKRKIKCDRQTPECLNCIKKNLRCVYQPKRFRGAGKNSIERTRKLEERLEALEQSLQPSGKELHEQVEICYDEHILNLPSGPRNNPRANSCQGTDSMVSNTVGPGALATQNSRTDLTLATTIESQPRNLYDKVLQARVNKSPFHMFVFNPDLSITDVLELFDGVVEDIGQTYPHLTMSRFENLIRPQGSDLPIHKAARQAIINASLAVAFHWKAENNAFGELSPLAWSHFKSAISIFPYLLFEASDVLACEAILTMAMFMQGTGENRMASQLVSAAVRVLQMTDAKKLWQHQKTELAGASQYHPRLLWTLASLDIDMSYRIGIPPAIPANDIENFFPHIDSGETTEIDVARYRAQLARIQIEVYHKLHSTDGESSQCSERSTKACVLYHEIQTWNRSLPISVRPIDSCQGSLDKIPLPVILLHFTFHDLKIKTVSAIETIPVEASDISARAMIDTLQRLPTQQFTVLWRILIYPISAVFLLLAVIVEEPFGSKALANFNALKNFSRLLSVYVNKGDCNLTVALEWVMRMVATAAEVLAGSTQERLSTVLSKHTDHLQLAQSLMGRPTKAYRFKIHELAQSLGISWEPIDDFGPFVPEVLKPHTFNCSFTFTTRQDVS